MEPSTRQEFSVSLYGRLYYLLWAFVCGAALYAVVSALFAKARVPSLSEVALIAVSGVLFAPMLVYSLSQSLRRGPKFIISQEAFPYHGLYVRRTIPWSQIQDCSLGGGGKGPDLLSLRLKGRTWWKGWVFFDVSSLSPNYNALYSVVCEYVKHMPNRVRAGI